MKKISILLALVVGASISQAEMVTFAPDFDVSSDVNTSGTTAYNANGVNLDTGIVDDGSSQVDAETFYFSDATTGIKFSYLFTITATDGFLNPQPSANGFGVGYGADTSSTTGWLDTGRDAANQFEGVTFAITGLNVDFSGYIANSIAGVTTPTLNAATVGFSSIDLSSFSAGSTELSLLDGTTTYVGLPSSEPLDLVGLGLSDKSGEISIFVGDVNTGALNSGTDNRIRINGVISSVQLDVIPEPASLGMIAFVGVGALFIRRRLMV